MTKQEALIFLELPAAATEAEIKNRLSERQAYFELLSEKAPSAFLRRVHTQHLEKIKSIQRESQFWEEEEPAASDSVVHTDEQFHADLKPPENIQDEIKVPEEPEPILVTEIDNISVAPVSEPVKKADSNSWKDELFSELPKKTPLPTIDDIKKQYLNAEPAMPVASELPKGAEQSVTATDANAKIPEKEINIKAASKFSFLEDEKPTADKPVTKSVPQNENKAPAKEEIKSEPAKDLPTVNPEKPVHKEIPEPIQQYDTNILGATVAWSNTQVRSKPVAEPVGWLIRHTEKQSLKHYPIFPGKNFIGRKAQPGLKPFIQMEEDPFVSRVHAAIYVEGTGPYNFYISDTSSSNGGKPSKNGTYVNGVDDRVSNKLKLRDGDTLQIGVTKFVLRYELNDLQKALEEVEDSSYMHTVVIDRG